MQGSAVGARRFPEPPTPSSEWHPPLRAYPFFGVSGLDAPITAPIDLVVRDLGEIAYAEACALQRDLQRRVIESRRAPCGERQMYLLLLEHVPPVITISRRRVAQGHLLAGGDQLAAAGVEVARTDRGGDITYHGPGQLVVYPILDLNTLRLRLHGYMRFLEQIAIDTLGSFGIPARRDPTGTGVWVASPQAAPGQGSQAADATGATKCRKGNDPASPQPRPAGRQAAVNPGRMPGIPRGEAQRAQPRRPQPRRQGRQAADKNNGGKICAMGVRISRWVSMHGLALNVTTNLDHFNLIVPCGLSGVSVTSMERELGDACPAMQDVRDRMCELFKIAVGTVSSAP